MTTCPTCEDLIRRRAVNSLADHLEQRHRVMRGVQREAQLLVFGTAGRSLKA